MIPIVAKNNLRPSKHSVRKHAAEESEKPMTALRTGLLLSSAVVTLGTMAPASAQTAPVASSSGEGDIVVTSQKHTIGVGVINPHTLGIALTASC